MTTPLHLALQTTATENRNIELDPSAGSGGIQFLRLTRGITLAILDCHLREPVSVRFDPPFESLGIGFSLAGQMEVRPGRKGTILTYQAGQTDLNTNPGACRIDETLFPGRLMRVCLTMNHEILEGLTRRDALPALLGQKPRDPAHYKGRVTPSMRSVITQILQCPFQDGARDLFLEGKVLELLAHTMEQLAGPTFHANAPVRPQDLERVHHAAELLTADLETAPGLEELARGVGMCRTRLHECFCGVYGVTPFEYLQRCRLETAMTYLAEGGMNVTEAAFAVGYASSGHFSKVFKKQYGAPPKKFVGGVRLGMQRTIPPKKRKIVHA